jgi:aminoglycoside N3'-acetyltransferase
MFFKELKKNLEELIGNEHKPIVIFSALWPLLRISNISGEKLCDRLLKILKEIVKERTLLMPSFTEGFKNGLCNLDLEKSQTGALSEYFRVQTDSRRSVCPFFSFIACGAEASEIISLRPRDVWGEGSLYEWMYKKNIKIVTIGIHPTHCSLTHYAEWVMRDFITYRYIKKCTGRIIHEGRDFLVNLNVFARSLRPKAINDFTWLLDKYSQNSMKIRMINGIYISSMDAKPKINLLIKIIKNDSLALVKNRVDFERNV